MKKDDIQKEIEEFEEDTKYDNMTDEELDEEVNKEIKKGKIFLFLGCAIPLLGCGLGFYFAIKYNHQGLAVIPFILLIFSSLIIGLVFLIKSFHGIYMHDYLKQAEIAEKIQLSAINVLPKGKLEEKLKEAKFKNIDGNFYYKKKFSFLKDSVSFYIRIRDKQEFRGARSIASILDNDFDNFEKIASDGDNCVLISVIYVDDLTEKDLEENKIIAGMDMTDQIMSPYDNHGRIYLLVSKNNGKGYFMDSNKSGLYLYTHGAKMIKRIFRPEN